MMFIGGWGYMDRRWWWGLGGAGGVFYR